MTIIYFSTVFRYAPNDQGGELVKLDWENKRVLNRVVISPKSLKINDPNPRGNSRGGRGIAVTNGKIYVASYCELQVFDLELNHLKNISHPLMSGLHEVFLVNDNQLWITCTPLDCALLLDLTTEKITKSYWPREMNAFQERWNLKPQELDKESDNRVKFLAAKENENPNHTHFNAISVWNGDVFGLLNRFGAVINLSNESVLIEEKNIWGCHNLLFSNEGLIFINDTRNQGIQIYDNKGKFIKRINLLPYHPISKKLKLYKMTAPLKVYLERRNLIKYGTVMPFFVRGLDINGDLLYFGISPASIICINWKTEQLIDVYNYSTDERIAVHGLRINKKE